MVSRGAFCFDATTKDRLESLSYWIGPSQVVGLKERKAFFLPHFQCGNRLAIDPDASHLAIFFGPLRGEDRLFSKDTGFASTQQRRTGWTAWPTWLMKAVYITEFGGPENLEIRDVPDPSSPTGQDVVVRVRGTALNRADLIQRRGHYPPPPGYSPNIPGLEFAGEIVETGSEITDLRTGDRVFAIAAGEAQAEYIKIDHRLLARIPDNLNFVEAAAVPEAFITAHDAVFTQAGIKPGESLLIHAVGSGVGLAALQLAKANGNRVVGTSRTKEKLDRCEEFGLDAGIVIGAPPEFADEIDGGVDVILDLVGTAYFAENLESLALKGRLVLVGLTSGTKAEFSLDVALRKRLTLIGTVLRARSMEEKADVTAAFIRDVVPLLAEGRVRPNVDRVFNVEDVRAAHEYLESNESFGKVVLEFS